VKSRVDDRLRHEARHFALRFTCDACAAFDPEHARCAYGFPTEPHRDSVLDGRDEILFCKAFELR
jgi:hypothetical protein